MKISKVKKRNKGKISLKILIPFTIAILVIVIIALGSLYDATVRLSEASIRKELDRTLELYNDFQLQKGSDEHWIESDPEVFYWDWNNDEYSLTVLHKSSFGFALFEYNSSTGYYEIVDDFDSGIGRILTADPSVLAYENCQQLENDGSFYYSTTEMKEGVLNKYYWLLVAQSDETMRDGYARRAYGIAYNITQSVNEIWEFFLVEAFFLIIPALLFSIALGAIIARMVKRIRSASEYVADIRADNLPKDPLVIQSNDELEEMADSVNLMVRGLKERERMANELSAASTLQAGMLIQDFPAFPNHNEFDIYATMTPAKEVGGDFYDMFMIDDTHLAVVIADVSDKGVSAALFMAMTKSLIKYLLPSDTPAHVLKSINKFLNDGNDKFMFVTCFVGVLDLESGEFSFANAGHNPPLIKMGKDGEYKYVDVKRNAILAVFPEVDYEGESIILPHGSKILLYTDGVTEAIDKDNVQYQEQRLLDCAKAHDTDSVNQVLPAIMKDIEDFRGETAQFDDITMLMVEYF